MGVGLEQARPTYFHSWLGLALTPFPSTVAGFIACGAEIDIKDQPTRNPGYAVTAKNMPGSNSDYEVTVVPVLRIGISIAERARPVPIANFYLLTGWRRSRQDGDAVRVGAGVAMPALLPLTALGIPTTIELTTDLGEQPVVASLRLGWSF
jgi:hypothetical protein